MLTYFFKDGILFKQNIGNIMELRTYQQKSIDDLKKEIRKGYKRIILYAPTGSGKTVIASKIILDAIQKNSKILFVIHRHQLVKQTKDTLKNFGIEDEKIGFIKAGFSSPTGKEKIIIASIQTLKERGLPENCNLIIVDECHTVSFFKFYKELDKKYENIIKIGLTASPWRKKQKEQMKDFFDSLVEVDYLSNLIENKYLAEPKYFSFDPGNQVNNWEKKENQFHEDEFSNSSLKKLCENINYNEKIVEKVSNYSDDYTGITFCATINQSKILKDLFNENGIETKHIDQNTSWETRENIFSELKKEKIQNITSVGILTEGFDAPNIKWIALARPINSKPLYIQILGRVLRPFPGKKYGYILDFGNNFKRFERKAKYSWRKSNCNCGKNHNTFIGWDHDIKLEEYNKENKIQQKTCPNCEALILKFFKICPECGYVFYDSDSTKDSSGLSKKDLENLFYAFKEIDLFKNEEKLREQFKYLRQQLKIAFKKCLNRDNVYRNYIKKYNENPPSEWYYGAIFGGNKNKYLFRIFLDYLYKSSKNKAINKQWIEDHFRLEFGNIDLEIPKLLKLKWFEILDVDENSSWEKIKNNYFDKVDKFFDDEETINLLDWAIDKAKEARK